MSVPTLPPNLQRLTVPLGVHRRWIKYVVFGGWKTGKSKFLASMPTPLLAIDTGEGGIGMFLPKNDPNYQCIAVTHPEEYQEAVNWIIAHEGEIQSVAMDGITSAWSDHMDGWQDKLGVEEIKGGDWRKVKVPWKVNLRRMMRANFHVGYSAWSKETEYSETPGAPGERGKLEIRPIDVPALERTVGYTIDMIFEMSVLKDKLNKPTSRHQVTMFGGRRPMSIPASEFHVGKKWIFDTSKGDVNVWDLVVAPLLPKWEDGAVDHLGIDPVEAERELAEMDRINEDETVGRLIRIIEAQTDLKVYAQDVWPVQIGPELNRLSEAARKRVAEAHNKKKGELTAKGGA